MKITPLNVGYLRADLSQWYGLPAEHPLAGRTELLPMQCHLIALPNRMVLVDAPAYDFPGEDEGGMLIPEYMGRSAAGLLAEQGIMAEAITDVVITHPHFDHTIGLALPIQTPSTPVFPKARHYLGAKDREKLATMEALVRAPLEAVERAGLLTLVDGELDLGDGLGLVPIPGETPGHQALWLKDAEGEAYICGDLFHHPLEFAEARHPVWADGVLAQASKSMLVERAAQSGARMYFTHIEGAWTAERGEKEMFWKRIEGSK